jgi:hypothetical protein
MDEKYPQYPIEEIPDQDLLFCRVHHLNLYMENDNVRIKPQAFDPTPYPPKTANGLSTNWSKYSSAEQTKTDARVPENYAVVSFLVQKVRDIPLSVVHSPTKNQAHTHILDIPPREQNDAKITLKLRDICKWEIPYSPQ